MKKPQPQYYYVKFKFWIIPKLARPDSLPSKLRTNIGSFDSQLSFDFTEVNTFKYPMMYCRNEPCEAVECKRLIIEAVKTLFGEVGASRPFDLVQYSEKDNNGVLRIPSGWLVEVRAAIIIDSRFQIQRVATTALSLVANSRTYQHSQQASHQTRKRKRSAST